MAKTPTSNAKVKSAFAKLPFDKARDNEARDRLIQARVKMLLVHDFWGKLVTRMKLINADEWCNTLATDGRNFYYNSAFVLALGSIDKVIFGFAHEVLHCLYDHFGRTGGRDPKLCNIAQDYCINTDLVQHNVGQKIDEIQILYDTKYYGWAFEAVYDELMKDIKNIDLDKLLDQLLDDHIQNDEGDGDGDGSQNSQNGNSTHRPGISKADRDAIRDELRESMLNAVAGSGAGNLPAGIQRMVNELTNPKMDWRQLIQMKIPSLIKNDYSYMRPNRKYAQSGIIVPGVRYDDTIDIAIAIDTSGSISMEQMKEVLSEVVGMMDMYDDFTMHIWQFDTNVYEPAHFTKDTSSEIMDYPLRGGGGTDFDANWKFMNEEGIEPKLLIVFTDGEPYGSWGDENYCDTLWIINNKYNKQIEPPFGVHAYYED